MRATFQTAFKKCIQKKCINMYVAVFCFTLTHPINDLLFTHPINKSSLKVFSHSKTDSY